MTKMEYDHSPLAKLDYGFNWTSWLAAGETITSSVWAVDVALTKSGEQNVSGVTSVFVEGGEVGKQYLLTNTITTSVGRKDSRIIKLFCKVR